MFDTQAKLSYCILTLTGFRVRRRPGDGGRRSERGPRLLGTIGAGMLRRLIGFVFVVAAVAGIVFSVYGLVQIWRYRPVVTKTVTDNLVLFDQTLSTTQQGLIIVGRVVQTTTLDVASLQTTTEAMARAIHDTNPMLDSLNTLTA